MIRQFTESYIRTLGNSSIELVLIVAASLFAAIVVVFWESGRSEIAMTKAFKTAAANIRQLYHYIRTLNFQSIDKIGEAIATAIRLCFQENDEILSQFIGRADPSIIALSGRDDFEGMFFSLSLQRPLKTQDSSFSKRAEREDRSDSGSFSSQNDERLQLALDATKERTPQIKEELFRALFEQIILGVAFTKMDGTPILVNQKLRELLGYTELELMSFNIRDLIDSEIWKSGCDGCQNPTSNPLKACTVEHRYARKDGTTFWGLSVVSQICDIPHLGDLNVILIRDISDRKEIEQNVRHNYDLREAIFSESTDAIFLVNSKTLCTVDCNPRAVELFEASGREELLDIEGHILQKRQFTPEEMEQIVREVEEKGSWSLEVEYVTQKGNEFWGNLSVKRIDVAGQKLNLVRVTDISDRKRIEQIKDEFSSTVSHELRTPLTSIYASLSLLNSGLYESHPEKQKQILAVATRATERLVRLVNDVLDIERLASGEAELEKSTCNVGESIEQSVDGVLLLAEQKQIVIIRCWPAASILANSDAIIQILTNLLSNAIKFSPPESTITISADIQNDNHILFQVQDRGCGIPEEQLEQIFKPFKQVKGAGRHPKGTGLGLAICQKLVHQHGGKIWADSAIAEGSTFSFTIPILARNQPPVLHADDAIGDIQNSVVVGD